MNRIARRSLITLGTGAAVLGTVLLSAGASGTSVAGKGVTSTDTIVAGTNWDRAPRTDWAGPTVIGAGWAGPTIVLAGRGKPTLTAGWAGPTAVEV